MDGITPVNNINTNVPSNQINTTSTFSLSIVPDSLQSASASNAPQSLLSFMNLLGTTSNNLQESLKLSNQGSLSSRIPFYLQSIDNGLSGAQIFAEFTIYTGLANVILINDDANVATLSSALSSFNSNVPADLAAVSAMNSAISQYQNGTISEATYNAAVATYNAYAATQATRVATANAAITTFNSATNTTNTSIDNLNNNIPPGGFPLTHQNTYSTKSSMPTIGTAPPVPTSSIIFSQTALNPTNNITPNAFTITTLSITASFTFISNVAAEALITTMLKTADKFTTYQIFLLAGKQLNLPNSYTLPANKISVTDPGSAGGSGSSVALATTAGPLSNPEINGILGHSIFISELAEIYATNNLATVDADDAQKFALTLQLSTSNLVSQMGLLSINSTIRLLGGEGALATIDPRSSLAGVALSLGLVNELKEAVAAGIFKANILALLKSENPNLSDEELNKQAEVLSAYVEAKVLALGTLNLANSLQSPELTGQLLGTVNNSGSNISFNDTLRLSENQQSLSSSISNSTNLSSEDSTSVINDAINAGNVSTANLQTNIQNALIKKGLDQETAKLAAIKATDEFNQEIDERFLAKTTITKESIKGTSLDSVGVNALLDQNNGSLSGIALRDKMALDFQSSGIASDEAKTTATTLISTLNKTSYKISQDELASELKNQTLNKTAGDSSISKANEIADELNSTLFTGNNSVSELLRDRINTIKKNTNKENDAKVEDIFKDFITPDLVTLGLAKILGDPATSALYIASGIIYTPDQSPSSPGSLNRQRLGSIDMPI